MSSENIIDDGDRFIYYEDNLIDSPMIIQKLLEIKKNKEDCTNLTMPWHPDLIPQGVGEVKIWDVEDIPIRSYLCYRIAEVFPKVRTNNYLFSFQVTEWQEGSFIPWHADNAKLCALTCYLKNDVEYGGDFLFKPFDDESIGMFLEPKPNRVVFLKGVKHCVSKIHKGTRTTLQVWGSKIDANV